MHLFKMIQIPAKIKLTSFSRFSGLPHLKKADNRDQRTPIEDALARLMSSLAGASLRDRAVASVGAVIGLGFVAALAFVLLNLMQQMPMLVAPIGASAVLLFAVPASPLAQPWAIIGGNTLSALVGIAVLHFVQQPFIAAGLGVGLAILVMSLTRCLHPPGGAAALLAILGGSSAPSAHFTFAFLPVCLNSVLLVGLGWFFHQFTRHSYPHRPIKVQHNLHDTRDPPPELRVGFRTVDVDAALAESGETYDINRADLDQLLRAVELHAVIRSHHDITCADVMSRDVLKIGRNQPISAAQTMMMEHNIRSLPVINARHQLCGIVGLRELLKVGNKVADVMVEPTLIRQEMPALKLLPHLTDGKTRAVVVVNESSEIAGLITQTDLLVALSRLPELRTK
eukprot:gene15530-15677_t